MIDVAHKTNAQKLRQRQSVETWYPRPSDLTLPDVPPEHRGEVCSFLASLDRVEVRPGHCWDSARVVLGLNSNRCIYVEGVWMPDDNLESPALGLHAWIEVDGYRVDLIAECFQHQRNLAGVTSRRYLYEPVKRFSPTDLKNLPLGSCLTSYSLYMGREEIPGLPEHLKNQPTPGAKNFKQVAEEFHTFVENNLFQAAQDRLTAKT